MSEQEKLPSWFWYGRFEGACYWWVPPAGLIPKILYLAGNIVGRTIGHSKSVLDRIEP